MLGDTQDLLVKGFEARGKEILPAQRAYGPFLSTERGKGRFASGNEVWWEQIDLVRLAHKLLGAGYPNASHFVTT